MITETKPHYAAFISYAHADEAVAARLHKALETYPVPKHLRREGRTTRPIFRDIAELTAAHSLSEKIRDAVNCSRVLIVLCSPAAKASHWVNEEIKLFREIHGEGAILSALIEGTPATSFPEALIQDGREPLAASLGASKAGFRLGVTQLAAGILGTGLDELVQRGAKRRSQRMGMGLAASLAFSAVMGFTAFQAVDARNEAELERSESEALLEYMVKDLKVKLEPVGRLDLLEGVGRKAIGYYDKKDIEDLSDDSLRLLAAARQVLAQVSLDASRMEEAQSEIEASAALTREVLARNPGDSDAIYAHAQSEYWVGEYYNIQNKYDALEKPWTEYNRLGRLLYQKDPTNFKYIMEAAWGANNLGILYVKRNEFTNAAKKFNEALQIFNEAKDVNPDSILVLNEIASTYGWLSDCIKVFGTYPDALKTRDQELEYLRNRPDFKSNYGLQFQYLEASYLRTRLAALGNRGEALERDFEMIFSEMALLIEHDADNLAWQLAFLRFCTDYYFYTDEALLHEKLMKKIEQLKESISTVETDSKRLEFFYIDLIKSRRANSIGGDPTLILNSIEGWRNVFPEGSEEDAIINSEFLNLQIYFSIDFEKEAPAQIVIDYYNDDFNNIEPKAVQRLISAHLVLEQCAAAAEKSKALQSRGYRAPRLATCEN